MTKKEIKYYKNRLDSNAYKESKKNVEHFENHDKTIKYALRDSKSGNLAREILELRKQNGDTSEIQNLEKCLVKCCEDYSINKEVKELVIITLILPLLRKKSHMLIIGSIISSIIIKIAMKKYDKSFDYAYIESEINALKLLDENFSLGYDDIIDSELNELLDNLFNKNNKVKSLKK